jgi:4-amino-4-deoxy-L-arabinose transferase-like glycosyltransferase
LDIGKLYRRWAWPSPARAFWLLLVGYLVLHLALRLAISRTLQHDEAEQPIFAQSLAVGYSGQPPLYTWLVWLLAQVFGMNLLTLALVKTSVLAAVYGFLFLAGRRLLDDRRAALGVASLLLVPLFAWEFVRDYTHTPLACALSAATLYALLRLQEGGRCFDYSLLGLLLGLGMLSKYNYALFALPLLLAALSLPSFRPRLLSPWVLLTVAVAALVMLPHLLWLVEHGAQVRGFLAGRAAVGRTGHYLAGVLVGTGSLLWNLFLYLTPLWLVYLLLFPQGFSWRSNTATDSPPPLLSRFLVAALVVRSLPIFLFGVTRFFIHWLDPMLLLFPLWFFGRVPLRSRKPLQRFGLVLGLAAAVVLGARVSHAWLGWEASKHADRDRLMEAQAQELIDAGFDRGTVITESHVIGGNLLLHLPQVEVCCVKYPAQPLSAKVREGTDAAPFLCCLVWDATYFDDPPMPLTQFLSEQLGRSMNNVVRTGFVGTPTKQPHRHSNRLGYALFPR